MDIVKKAESEAKEKYKKDFKASTLGTGKNYIVVSMTNSEITDGLDRPLYIFDKRVNNGKIVLGGDLLFEPIDDLYLNNLTWQEL